jgi:hypothetical protein
MKNPFILALVLILSTALAGPVYYPNSNSMQARGEDDCEDQAFKKYMKKGDKPFERYLDRADDVPLPKDENDVKDYLDDLEPLADDYIDDLEPFAQQYTDDLEDCLN